MFTLYISTVTFNYYYYLKHLTQYYDSSNFRYCVSDANTQYSLVQFAILTKTYDYSAVVYNPTAQCYNLISPAFIIQQDYYVIPSYLIVNSIYVTGVNNMLVNYIQAQPMSISLSNLIDAYLNSLEKMKQILIKPFEINIVKNETTNITQITIRSNATIKELQLVGYVNYTKVWEMNTSVSTNNLVVYQIQNVDSIYYRIKLEDGRVFVGYWPTLPFLKDMTPEIAILLLFIILFSFFMVSNVINRVILAVFYLIINYVLFFASAYPIFMFLSIFFLVYIIDYVYAIYISKIEDDFINSSKIVMKVVLASIALSSFLSFFAIPTDLPISVDIQNIQNKLLSMQASLNNVFNNPVTSILTLVNLVIQSIVLVWDSLSLLVKLFAYLISLITTLDYSIVSTVLYYILVAYIVSLIARALFMFIRRAF